MTHARLSEIRHSQPAPPGADRPSGLWLLLPRGDLLGGRALGRCVLGAVEPRSAFACAKCRGSADWTTDGVFLRAGRRDRRFGRGAP